MKQQHLATPRLNALAAAVATCFTVNAHALPTAPTVTNGTASFQQTTNSLTVTNSSGAIIHWGSFSIGAGEATRFIQPSASSSVLNRVLGGDPSQIYGSLSSNGRIYLVNPAGIFIGPGGTVNAAAFVASTLAISDADFLAGRLIFSSGGSAGTVENQGVITTPEGGSVYLIGSQVVNTGTIDAPNGEVMLAAGQSVQLINTGTPGVTVEFSASDGASELVQNFGTIAAAGGQIGLASALVKNSGTLNASSVSRQGGRIFLRASKQVEVDAAGRIVVNGTTGGSVQVKSADTTLLSGVIEAKGSTGSGGRVEVLGDKVGVFDGAVVDVSGSTGGGTILVGGDLQGRNADVQNAQITWLGRDAELRADAIEAGDGGKIIVWADDTTRAYGQVSARGGASGGDGGFVELSGKRYLDFQSAVDVGAPLGIGGTLLLDPMNVTIAYTNITNPAAFYGDATWFETADGSTTTTLGWISYGGTPGIQTLLNAGTNVIVTTAGSNTSYGDITLSYGGGGIFDWSSSAKLKLLAHNQIYLDNTLSSPTGSLEMMAGWNGASITSPTVGTTAPSPTIVTGTSGSGYIEVPTVVATAYGSISLTDTNNRINDLTAFSSTGSITYNGGASSGANDIYLRNLQAPNGAITVNTNNTYGGNVTLGFLQAATSGTGNVSVTARNAILEDDVGTADIVAYGASLTSATGSGSAATLAISADLTINTTVNASASGSGYGGIRIQNVGATNPTSVALTDDTLLGAGKLVSYSTNASLLTGSVSLTSNYGGDLQLSTAGSLDNTNFSMTFGGASIRDIGVFAGSNLSLGATSIFAGRNIAVSAGGALTLSSASLTAGSGGTASLNGQSVDILSSSSIWAPGGAGISGGAVTIDGNSSVQSSDGAVSIIGTKFKLDNNSNVTSVRGISVAVDGDIEMSANSFLETGETFTPSLYDIQLIAGGSLTMQTGSYISGANDVFITLQGGQSEIDLSGNSYILSKSNTNCGFICTTYVNFLARAQGGIVIDGVQTTTTSAGGSGFFVTDTSTPAILGGSLKITYASGVDPVSKEIGSIFDDDTRDTEDINEFETEEVKERADEFAEEKSDESSGKSKPSQCT